MSLELFADLEWRGLLAQTTDREALVKELKSAPTKFYIGFVYLAKGRFPS